MSDANTRRIRLARARIRAAATLLRDARGLDSMAKDTEESLRLLAILLVSLANECTEYERRMNRHVAAWNKRRKGAK